MGGAFVFALFLWNHVHWTQDLRKVSTEYRRERLKLLVETEKLIGESVLNLAYDYSWWTDMVEFVSYPDPEWADTNLIDDLEVPWRVNLARVYTTDFDLVFQTGNRTILESLELAPDLLRSTLGPGDFAHFYYPAGDTAVEIRIAPIQEGELDREVAPIEGYFVVMRLWDEEHLKRLGTATGMKVRVDIHPNDKTKKASTALHNRDQQYYEIQQILPTPVQDLDIHLHALYTSPVIEKATAYGQRQQIFFAIGILIVAAVIFSTLQFQLVRPLVAIGESLQNDSEHGLKRLSPRKDEFGSLARLIQRYRTQRLELKSLSAKQEAALAALSESERKIREQIWKQEALGRDLHDGLIQSLYAVGLQMEYGRRVLHANPQKADELIQMTKEALDQAIRDLRGFISGLTPEEVQNPDVRGVVTQLCESYQRGFSGKINLALQLPESYTLPPAERTHLYFVCQEILSNAVRHGNASQINCTLMQEAQQLVILVEDNGEGFDIEALSPRGRGLRNCRARAGEIGGKFHIESSPENGTVVTFRVPLKS